jgi:starch synthase (maltosyl-transferring)
LILPGETGWLVPPGDAAALAAALREAAGDRDRLKAYGAAGRRRVESRFTQAAVVRAYDRLWSRLLGFEDEPFKESDGSVFDK